MLTNQNRNGARVSMMNSTVNAAMERLQKVRKFKHDSKMRLETRPSSSNLASISENQESSEHYRMLRNGKVRIPSVSDNSKEKRAKYACSEAPQRPIPDVSKTAEFAYFKKLKEEMGSNRRDQIKVAGETGQNTDELRKLESKNPVSPLPRVIKRLDFDCSGDEHAGKGVVEGNLSNRLGIANSYPEVGEGCSKGFDSVLAPQSHLFPESYENECPSSEERKIDTTDQLASSREPYNEEKISTGQYTSNSSHASLCRDDFPLYWLGSPRKRGISKCSSSEHWKIDDSYQLATPRVPYSEEAISTFNFGSFHGDDFPEYWLDRPRRRVISKWGVADVSTYSTEYNAGISSRIEEMDSLCSFPEHQHDRPRNRVISKWDGVVNSGSPSVEHYAGIGSQIKEMDTFYSFPEHQHYCPKWDSIADSSSPSAEHSAGIGSRIEEMNPFCGLDGEVFKSNVLETDLFCYRGFDDHRYIHPEYDLRWMDRAHDPSNLNTLLLGWDTNQEKEQHIGFSSTNSAAVACQQTWDDSLLALDMHESSSCPDYSWNLNSLPRIPSARESSRDLRVDDEDEDDPCCVDAYSGGRFLPFREFFKEDYTSSSHILELPFNSKEEDHVDSLAFVQDIRYVLQQDEFGSC